MLAVEFPAEAVRKVIEIVTEAIKSGQPLRALLPYLTELIGASVEIWTWVASLLAPDDGVVPIATAIGPAGKLGAQLVALKAEMETGVKPVSIDPAQLTPLLWIQIAMWIIRLIAKAKEEA